MSKHWTPNRPTVELRVSKIRREPPPPSAQRKSVLPDSEIDETWVVAIGVIAFALAITVIIFAFSDYLNPANQPAPVTISAES